MVASVADNFGCEKDRKKTTTHDNHEGMVKERDKKAMFPKVFKDT